VIRLFLDAPLLPVNRETLYGGSEQGYTDYPILGTSLASLPASRARVP
jgi:hypothetical protein